MHYTDSERTEMFPSGVCASVEEATGLSGGISQQLICGQRTDLLTMRSKPESKYELIMSAIL